MLVSCVKTGELGLVTWRDNKGVLLMSRVIGCDHVGTCKRWCKEAKKMAAVPQPAVAAEYSRCVGDTRSESYDHFPVL